MGISLRADSAADCPRTLCWALPQADSFLECFVVMVDGFSP
jgi:hypothetical protein